MFKQPKPEVLLALGGLLLGAAVILATDQVKAYGYALAALILAAICIRPVMLQIKNQPESDHL